MSRSKVDSALLNDLTATKRQNDRLVPFGGVFPHKLIQFLEDFDRSRRQIVHYFTPATNITGDGGTHLLLSEKNKENKKLSPENHKTQQVR